MKEKVKITRHAIPDNDTPEFLFLGIVTTEPDYRLSVILNKRFGISLRHDPAGIVDGTGESAAAFSVFNTTPPSLSLVTNKSHGTYLVRKLKNIDFFLVIHDIPEKKKAESFAAEIRTIQEVTAVFIFNSSEIKDKKVLLLA